jgi:hypothetical protein
VKKIFAALCLFSALAISSVASAQIKDFERTLSLTINQSPDIKITEFYFFRYVSAMGKATSESRYKYRNVGKQDVIAFELSILRFDPFDRQLPTIKSLIPGFSARDYASLPPDIGYEDGLYAPDLIVFTSIIFVAAVRRQDGTVWRYDRAALKKEIAARFPSIGGSDIELP